MLLKNERKYDFFSFLRRKFFFLKQNKMSADHSLPFQTRKFKPRRANTLGHLMLALLTCLLFSWEGLPGY